MVAADRHLRCRRCYMIMLAALRSKGGFAERSAGLHGGYLILSRQLATSRCADAGGAEGVGRRSRRLDYV